ncbi:MAG: PAS domain-containing protein [Spirochaetales bacterium]|nr:PAS domain-containing protein [Spirochaetales bacterium]
MELSTDLQEQIVDVLQEDNTIVFIMSHTGRYLSLLGGSNRALYSDGSVLIGKSYPEVLSREKAEFFQSLLDRVVEEKKALEVEYSLTASDFLERLTDGPDKLQKFRGNLYPLDYDAEEQLHKVVWVVHNITDLQD